MQIVTATMKKMKYEVVKTKIGLLYVNNKIDLSSKIVQAEDNGRASSK